MQIRFDRRLYQEEAIKIAMEVYKDLAEFQLKEQEGWFEVQIEPLSSEFAGDIAGEFSNYVLAESKA